MYVTPFFGDASKRLLTPYPPEEVLVLDDLRGRPVTPGPIQATLPAGARAKILKVEFPTSWGGGRARPLHAAHLALGLCGSRGRPRGPSPRAPPAPPPQDTGGFSRGGGSLPVPPAPSAAPRGLQCRGSRSHPPEEGRDGHARRGPGDGLGLSGEDPARAGGHFPPGDLDLSGGPAPRLLHGWAPDPRGGEPRRGP
ncbi:conserved hypothetical protein, partial [Stigmatella aurantiaca DW4/3-1]